ENGALLNNPSAITIGQAGTLALDNTGTVNLADRLTDQAAITMSGGTLAFIGGSSGDSSETVGIITLTGLFSNTIESLSNNPGGKTVLSSYGLANGAGSAVNFVGGSGSLSSTMFSTATDFSATGNNQIVFLTAPTVGLTNGVFVGATVEDSGGSI